MANIYRNDKLSKEEVNRKHKLELAAIAAKQLKDEELQERFDPYTKGSRPTPLQQQIIDSFSRYEYKNYVVSGGNQSGKSQTCAYLIAHLLMENLPNWKRLDKWGDAPILILWASRQGKQIEASLWPKCRPFLRPGTYKEVRQGGQLQRVIMDNGNTLLFISYQNLNESTEACQSFTGMYAFLDELPSKAKLIEEMQNRVLKQNGIFMAAFTPKKPAPEVRRILDNADPRYTAMYRLRFLDNPGMDASAKEMQIAKAKQYGEKMMHAILEGSWVDSDSQVFYIDEDRVVRALPPHYDQYKWKHVESSDPAFGSGFGLVVLAEDPYSGHWYVVRAKVLSGAEVECPSISVATIKRLTAPYNVTKRIADPAALAYLREARKLGMRYSQGPNKQEDFMYFIDITQEAIGRRVFITPEASDLLDQMSEYSYDPNNPERIINRKKFHLIDAFRYAIALMPKWSAPEEPTVEEPFTVEGAVMKMIDKAKEVKKKSFLTNLKRVNTLFHSGR